MPARVSHLCICAVTLFLAAYPSPSVDAQTVNKIETEIGSYRVRFYGTVLLNTSVSRAGIFGQDIPLWTLPSGGNVTYPDGTVGHSSDSHDLIFTMRQSIVGLTLNQSQPSDKGWSSSALIEADFFGSRPVDTVQPQDRVLNQPRLRTAYFQLEHKGVKLFFGQATRTLFSKILVAHIDRVPDELVELETAHSRRHRQSISRLFHAGLTARGFRREYVMRDQLPNVRVPTTFLWGEHDAFMTPEEGSVAARLVPGGRFEVISGAGHLPSTDQPEATAALLEAALGTR